MATDIENTLREFGQFGLFSHNPENGIGLWKEEQELLLTLVGESKNYLEIGSHNLGSALLVERHAKVNDIDRKVCAVDIEFSPWAGLNFDRAKSKITLVERDSSEVGELKDVVGEVDFAFIDGYHSFSQVLKDFEGVYNLLADEAIVAFHDTSPFLNKEDYVKKCAEFANTNFSELIEDETENFYVDEAIACILQNYPDLEIIDCTINCYHPRETRLTSWIRGTTSPHSAIWAIRKTKNEN